jgi:hypothetical protein
MSLAAVLNVAYALLTEGMDGEAREAFDAQFVAETGPPSRRARQGQQDLMKAMGLGRR